MSRPEVLDWLPKVKRFPRRALRSATSSSAGRPAEELAMKTLWKSASMSRWASACEPGV